MEDDNHRKDYTLERVVAEFLYTSDNMFGDVKFDAEVELYRRIPPPDWAIGKRGGIPTVARDFYNDDGTRKEESCLKTSSPNINP